MNIERLSYSDGLKETGGSTLVMVGSFAPVHYGHLDVMKSAERAVSDRIGPVNAAVFAPNSDSYVSIKLSDTLGEWSFDRRITEFDAIRSNLDTPVFVDDLTGLTPPERSISDEVIQTVSQRLGLLACQAILVVGSDQIASMRPHLENNRAVCVVRPNYEGYVQEAMQEDWLREAVSEGRYIITTQEDPDLVISSTAIRHNFVDAKGGIL